LTPNANTGQFSQPLTLPPSSLLQRLQVQVTDIAGNGQTLTYQFRTGALPPASDTDVLDGDTVPFPPLPVGEPTTTPVTNPNTGAMGSSLQDWVRGWTGGWGFGSGGSGGYSFSGDGSGGSPFRLIFPPDNAPDVPPPDYLEKVGIILAQAALSLPEANSTQQQRKGSFINRASVLMAIAEQVQQLELYDLMSPNASLYQDYMQANQFTTRSRALQEGIQLASDLSAASDAIKVEVLKNQLLLATYSALKQHQPTQLPDNDFEEETITTVMAEFAKIYAALNPQTRPGAPTSSTPDFLSPLWQAQTPNGQQPQPKALIQQNQALSTTRLGDLMRDHPNPLGAMKLATNLLKAASNIAELRQFLHHADVVQELVGLAFKQTRFNDPQRTAQGLYGETLERGLDLLLNQSVDTQVPRDTQAALAQGFKYLTTTEQKLQLIRLVGNLLEVAPQVPGMQAADSGLIAMATAYLALNPTGTMAADDPLKFLETLTQDRTPALIQQGVTQLQAFLATAATEPERQRLMQMGVKTLQAAKQVQLTSELPELRQQMSDVAFLNRLLEVGAAYSVFEFSPAQPSDPPLQSFLYTLYRAQTQAEIKQGGAQLDDFLRDPSFGTNPAKRVKLMDFTADLLKAAKPVPGLSQPTAQAGVIHELVELGRAYAALDAAPDPNKPDPKSFLNTLWRTQDLQKGRAELEQFLNDHAKAPQLELFEFEKKLLLSLKMTPDADVQTKLKDASFLHDMLDWGAKYVTSKYDENLVVNELENFFQVVADSQYDQGVLVASNDLRGLLQQILKYLTLPESAFGDLIKYLYVEPLVTLGIQPNIDAGDSPNLIEKARAFARSAIPLISAELFKYGVVDSGAIAYVFATAEHETFGWFRTEEVPGGADEVRPEDLGNDGKVDPVKYFNRVYANVNGNGNFQSGDGYRYRGQGFAQVTGKENYQKFTVDIDPGQGINKKNLAEYVANELAKGNAKAAQDFRISAQTLVQGMKEGLFTKDERGVPNKLDRFFGLEKEPRFDEARDIVNPDDAVDKISKRAKKYLEKLKSFLYLR
jgi:hypothetical protein